MNPNDTSSSDSQNVAPVAATTPAAPTNVATEPAQAQPMPSIEPSVATPVTEPKADVIPDVPGVSVVGEAPVAPTVSAPEPVATTQAPDPSQAVVNEPTETVPGGQNE